MKRFISKIMILLLALAFCLFLIFAADIKLIGGQYKNSYNAAMIDKISRLVSIDEPKIILAGNSTLAFGIQSELIEQALEMPVVNLGLHGGLGNAFHEEAAKIKINEGDIVVICHTSYSDNDRITDPSLAWLTYDLNSSILPIFRGKDIFDLAAAYPDYFRNALMLYLKGEGNQTTVSSYCRTSFNKYGDIVYRPDYEQVDTEVFFKDNLIYIPDINETCINRLNRLNQYITEKGANMVVAAFPIAYGEYATFDVTDLKEFQMKLEAVLECPVISDYTDYLYPYSYFYNTTTHLTSDGAKVRTEQLICDLQQWFTDYQNISTYISTNS